MSRSGSVTAFTTLAAALGGAWLATAPIAAQVAGPAMREAPLSDPVAADRDGFVWSRLQRRVGHFQAHGPLDRVLAEFAHDIGVQIHVRWRLLADAGVAREDRVEIDLRDVRAETLLSLILCVSEDVVLDYDVRDGVLLVGTREGVYQDVFVHMFDVSGLLQSWSRPHDAGRAGAPAPGDDEEWDSPGARLVKLITDSVNPDVWMVNGGKGSISVVNGTLVVRTDRRSVRMLREFLENLRTMASPAR